MVTPERLLELWNSGMSGKEIATMIGTYPEYITSMVSRLRKNGWDFEKRGFDASFTEYDVYKGDEYICSGTAEKVAEMMNVKPSTVKCWATPSFHNRCKNYMKKRGYIAYRINLQEEELDIE